MPELKSTLRLFGVFILAYALILPSWLLVKEGYNRLITESAFRAAAWKYDLHVTHAAMKNREMTFTLSNTIAMMGPKGMMTPFEIDLSLDVESVTFNVPMTLALLCALIVTFATLRKTALRASLIGLGALLALHLLTLSVIAASLFAGTTTSNPMLHFYFSRFFLPIELLENLGMLLNSYAARFEPFLIAVLVWWQLHNSAPKTQNLPSF
ncbi:MAG: hypothetical protein JXK05_09045 [Campylobacterales bacterium]|nr:hypothetical protein [Campylobacterales bacterium]